MIVAAKTKALHAALVALSFWSRALGVTFEIADGCAGPGCVTVDTYPVGAYWKAGYTDCYRGRCQVRIREDWAERPEIYVHEFGHVLGLPHSEDRNSVMYPMTGGACYGRVCL